MPLRKRFLLAAFAASLLAACAPAPPPAPASPPPVAVAADVPATGTLDSLLRDARERHGVPAMAAAVVRPGAPTASGVVGVRRMGRPARATVQDRFHIGSNTKAMTATLAALLVREGAVRWETTVGDAFPEMVERMAAGYRGVTLQQLLSHQGGLPAFTGGSAFEALPVFEGSPREQRRAFAAHLFAQEPAYAPGTQFLYSNASYAVAAALLEEAAGRSWEDLLRARLFAPLGVRGEVGWPARGGAPQPWGHWTEGGDTLRPHDPAGAYRLDPFVAPAGDVNMAIGDYAAFLRMHLRGLRGAGRRSTHAGSAGTFLTLAAVEPAPGVAVAVFANAGGDRAMAASTELLSALLQRYGEPE